MNSNDERRAKQTASAVLPVVMQRHARKRAKQIRLRGLDPVVRRARQEARARARDGLDVRRAGDVVVLPLEVQRVRVANLPEVDGVDAVGRGGHDLSPKKSAGSATRSQIIDASV